MEKEDVLKALKDFQEKECNPYLYGGFSFKIDCLHSEAWVTGGVTGGSCYDEGDSGDGSYTDPHYDREPEEPNTIENLEKFLREFYPDLSLSQYNELMAHVKTEDWSEYEYYGNYTNYECAYITFDDIVNYFVNMNKPKLVKSYNYR